jgi:hypothetical protein
MILKHKISNKRLKLFLYEIICFISLSIAYCLIISDVYNYMGFNFTFKISRFTLGISIVGIFTMMGIFIKDKIIYAIWNILLVYNLYGTIIIYQYNGSSFKPTIATLIMLSSILFVSCIKFNFKPSKYNIELNKSILRKILIVSLILLIPFIIRYIDKINLKNLLLIDIYDTRLDFREINMGVLGYLVSPLTRVVAPILMAYSIKYKKKNTFFLSLFIIVYIFLCGAVKSIFIGIFAVILFYRGDYIDKPIIFVKLVTIISILGIVLYYVSGNLFLLDGFVRRVFFTPPYLDNIYYDFFTGNYTYGLHSPLGEILGKKDSVLNGYTSLSMYIGDGIMKEAGSNANVGVLTEGYFSFGWIGVIISSLVIGLTYNVLRCTNMDSILFGVIFIYIYYLNTSFISTLMLTHGLALFLIFSILFLYRKPE